MGPMGDMGLQGQPGVKVCAFFGQFIYLMLVLCVQPHFS